MLCAQTQNIEVARPTSMASRKIRLQTKQYRTPFVTLAMRRQLKTDVTTPPTHAPTCGCRFHVRVSLYGNLEVRVSVVAEQDNNKEHVPAFIMHSV